MANEQKAKEIAEKTHTVWRDEDGEDISSQDDCYEAAMKMANWKDELYKLSLDAKDQSIIQTEMDFNSMPISKLGGWHTEPPTEDGCYLVEAKYIPYKNSEFLVAEYDTNAKTWYDEAFENSIDIKRWKRI